jgi:SAM-dependent methyltransferase
VAGAVYPFVLDILGPLPADATVLEVGCGAQQYRPFLPARYVGLDLPSTQYATAGESFLGASAEHIPIRTESVDAVFGVAVFLAIADADAAFRECHRVLVAGGRLVVFDYQAREARRLRAADSNHHHAWTSRDLTGRLVAAGFDPDRMQDLSRTPLAKRYNSWPRWLVRRLRRLLRHSTWLVISVER